MTSRKQRISDAFSAAEGYDAAAGVQDRVAAGLAARLAPLPAGARVLEVGCGTGLLTRRLPAVLGRDVEILATDLSPAMVARARQRAGGPGLSFAAMDAEAPAVVADGFALIVSSLAAQWFQALPAALDGLARRLAPGGRMMLTLPGPGSLEEWRVAHRALGLVAGTPSFPEAAALAAIGPAGGTVRVESETFVASHRDGMAFARTLTALGATVPRPGHRPLSAGQLRRVLARLGSPCAMTWEIHTYSFVRTGIDDRKGGDA